MRSRKLLKALVGAGWRVIEEREHAVLLRHPTTGRPLTLPAGRFTLPDQVAEDLAELTGVRPKGG